MRLDIKVIPSAKKNAFKDENGTIKIYLTAPAQDGRANKALIEFLADYFKVAKNQIEITKGLRSRHKTVNILKI